MNTETYGKQLETLEEAIHMLDLAHVSYPKCNWVIECRVTKKFKKNS